MTIYIRVPPSLKTAIEYAAASSGQSINTWMMRAAEAQLKKDQEYGITDSNHIQ
jgi:predicted HicB family RNase H-like nuclease